MPSTSACNSCSLVDIAKAPMVGGQGWLEGGWKGRIEGGWEGWEGWKDMCIGYINASILLHKPHFLLLPRLNVKVIPGM